MAFYIYIRYEQNILGYNVKMYGMVFSYWFACDNNFELLFYIDENFVVFFNLLTWVFVWPGTWMESSVDLSGWQTKHGELLCQMTEEPSGVGNKGCKLFGVAFHIYNKSFALLSNAVI
jgi:hypothetical protein